LGGFACGGFNSVIILNLSARYQWRRALQSFGVSYHSRDRLCSGLTAEGTDYSLAQSSRKSLRAVVVVIIRSVGSFADKREEIALIDHPSTASQALR